MVSPRPASAGVLLAALLLPPALPLQAQITADSAMVARIIEEAENRSQVLASFHTLTNEIGPRLTGSPGYSAAAQWAMERLDQWGLSAARLEPWHFGRGWELEKLTLELVSPRYFPLIGYPEAWTPSTPGVIEGIPVYLGDRTAQQVRAMAARIRGAIVLPVPPQTRLISSDRPQPADHPEGVRIGAPPTLRSEGPVPRRELTALLAELGAGAVLWPNQGTDGTVFVLGRRDTPDSAAPSVVLAAEHYNLLARLLQGAQPVRVRVEVQARYLEEEPSSFNVLAEIPGTDPEVGHEVVMLGAHLDSWHGAAGATDNADGVAAAMEAVRILQAVGAGPRRTIRVALWGGEEQGLLGARQWVRQHLTGEPGGGESVYVYFNDDPGSGPTYGWYLEENQAIQPLFDAWLAPLVPLVPLGARRNVPNRIGSTDHVAFRDAGVPAFTTLKDYTGYDVRTHHTNADFFERVGEQDLKQSAIVLAVFAWHAAMHQGPLPR